MVKIVSPVTQRQVDAEQIDFEAKAEPWTTHELADGTILRVRVILTGVMRIEGEYDQSGNPIYVVSSQTVIQANSPKKLRGTPTVGAMPPPARTVRAAPPDGVRHPNKTLPVPLEGGKLIADSPPAPQLSWTTAA